MSGPDREFHRPSEKGRREINFRILHEADPEPGDHEEERRAGEHAAQNPIRRELHPQYAPQITPPTALCLNVREQLGNLGRYFISGSCCPGRRLAIYGLAPL